MLSGKIKGILAVKNIKIKDFAAKLGIKPTTLSTKIMNNTWSLKDLAILAEETNLKLCIINKNKEIIMTIDTEDLEK
jgi:uncharacterized protein YjcR